MNMKVTVCVALTVLCVPPAWSAAEQRSERPAVVVPDMDATLAVQDVAWDGERLRGRLVNESSHTLRNPELLLRYNWVWHDVRADNPGNVSWAEFRRLEHDLAPGSSVEFSFEPGRTPPRRDDGRLVPAVDVAQVVRMP